MPIIQQPISAAAATESVPAMEVHPVTLRFNGPLDGLESPFLNQYTLKSLPQVRVAALLAAVFYGLFAILDGVVAPELKHQLWRLRFTVVCPAFLIVFLLSYSRHFIRHMQPILAAGFLIGGLGIVYMTMVGNVLMLTTYYAGLMLALMLGYCFIWARFIWATVSGWILVLAYVLTATLWRPLPPEILINNSFFCVSANLIGMVVCYAFEYYARRDFYLRHLLSAEHRKVAEANAELEQRVADRTRLLAKANAELRREIQTHQRLSWEKQALEGQLRQAQKMEAIGTLAGGIAHDFNNILAAIMGHTELALLQINEPDEVQTAMDEVLKASQRAKELVGQILSFSRQDESRRRPVQIGPVVQEALRLLRASLPATIGITQTIEARESIVMADPTQIHQIVINLCTNAGHAMLPQGGRLLLTLKDVSIPGPEDGETPGAPPERAHPGLVPGRYVCLNVTDTGHGIEPRIMERIFDPYFTTKEKGVGTGLGLAVVRGIVQNHGGMIELHSTPGRGTTALVYLPRIDEQAATAIQQMQGLRHGRETILIVDDEEGLAALGAKLLNALGYRADSFTDPEIALSAFADQPDRYDLIITDMIMPKMSGDALARAILALRPDMPIIIHTGYTDTFSSDRLKQMGVSAVLRKPINIQTLSQTIHNVIMKRAAAPWQTD